ncbi:hypothetical protein G9A89_000274 [Geosiphon pyriformis]|nr:hypothetical protein G9A89_000274 [Geosiphon pyriformis]
MPRKTSLHKKKGRDSWERLSEVNEKESSSFQKTSSPQRPIDLPPTVFINQSSEKPSNEVDLIPAPIWYRPNYDQKDIFDNRHQFEVEQGPDVLSFYPAYPTLENSPIESVRATVSKNDDRTLPCLTFRFWVLSFFFTVFGAAFSQYYYFTTIPYQFSVFFVQLATYPLGRLMAKVLPRKTIRVGEWFCFSLNPGPFNMKEHALIGVAASASAYPYAIYALTAQKLFFAQQFSHVGSLFLLISSQCLGYGLAGMVYPILVEMPDMIWPLTLVNVAFYNTLHETKYNFIRSLSRMQFFWIVFICIFIWELLPQFFAPILMSFTVLCYFGHKNPHLVNLGSANRGVGILGITFDWMQITTFMPLSSPWV